MAGPEVARMIAEFEDDTTRSHRKDGILVSGFEAIFVNDVTSLSVVEEMGSPFLEESEDLLVLDTRDNMNVTVWETVRNVEIPQVPRVC